MSHPNDDHNNYENEHGEDELHAENTPEDGLPFQGQISALHDSDAFGELQGELEVETLEYGFTQQEFLQNAWDLNPQQIVHPIEQRANEKRNPPQRNVPAPHVRHREPRQP